MSGEMALVMGVILLIAIFFRITLPVKTPKMHPYLRKALIRLTEYAIVVIAAIAICSLFGKLMP